MLEGKIAIVTGAGRGLGRAYALDLAQRGAKVVVNDIGCSPRGEGRDPSVAEDVVETIQAQGGEAIGSTHDVSRPDEARALVAACIDAFGRVDVLVNNAGITRDALLLETSEEDWRAVIDVHLGGTFLCSRAAAEVMVDQDEGGAIINTVSLAGMRGHAGQSNYAAAKAGIFGLTRSMAQELFVMGVRVNAVAPVAATRMSEGATFLGEAMEPARVAPLIAFLASDAAARVNGRVFGAHGSSYFEYAMASSEGTRRDAWSVEEIAASIDAIAFDPRLLVPEREQASHPLSARNEALLARLPDFFRPRRAVGWEARLLLEVEGCASVTLVIRDGACRVERGRDERPSCAMRFDAESFWRLAEGRLDPQRAFVEGSVYATELIEMFRFYRAFELKRASAAVAAEEGATR